MDGALIFFDVDGTITDERGFVPPSAARAIRRARARGNLCLLNTGRPQSHVESAVMGIGFDGGVFSCGQLVTLGGRTLLRETLAPEVCRELAALTRRCGLDVVFEAEEGIWFDHSRPICPEFAPGMERFAQRGFDVYGDMCAADFRFDKFCVWVRDGSEPGPFLACAERYCTVIDRGGGLLELVKRGCSKETGAERIMAETGVPLSRCYALGDSANDLAMLKKIPHGIAMGESPEHVKAAAEFVTDTLHNDGLARALEHYGLA